MCAHLRLNFNCMAEASKMSYLKYQHGRGTLKKQKFNELFTAVSGV